VRSVVNSNRSLALGALLVAASSVSAQQAIPLYPSEIPNSRPVSDEENVRDPNDAVPFIQDISRPQLFPYPLAHAHGPRPAIVILPGGGYRGVSIEKEGFAVAKQLNAYGVAAFVVKYRTPSDKHMVDKTIGPLQDAQQALRLVRERAHEWNVDPNRVGLLGFSAGGHLASTAATKFDKPVLPGASAEQVRPNFLMLGYPVISFRDELVHAGSREMLLGATFTLEQVAECSNELQVTARTPPTFIFHAADDQGVVVANSLRFFEALQSAGVQSELIVYPRGGHGFGLDNPTTPDRWIERLRDWLQSQGFLRSDEQLSPSPTKAVEG
jgi:acetyl esterase/lipase